MYLVNVLTAPDGRASHVKSLFNVVDVGKRVFIIILSVEREIF
jgi:hypothetical protein